jgi:hypothetical protein
MKVHDRDDKQNIAPHLINYSVRKLVGSAAAGSFRDRRLGFGILKDSLDCTSHFFGEMGAEPLLS